MVAGLAGGCACGAVRYATSAEPVMAFHCHCRDCQRASGTQGGSYLLLPRATLQLTGEVRFFDSRADSGNTLSRGFCPNCGAPVVARSSGHPEMIAVTAASLDQPDRFRPQAVLFKASAPVWAVDDPALPVFARTHGGASEGAA